jgi:hypothetical protein
MLSPYIPHILRNDLKDEFQLRQESFFNDSKDAKEALEGIISETSGAILDAVRYYIFSNHPIARARLSHIYYAYDMEARPPRPQTQHHQSTQHILIKALNRAVEQHLSQQKPALASIMPVSKGHFFLFALPWQPLNRPQNTVNKCSPAPSL